MKHHRGDPWVCDALEETEAKTFRASSTTQQGLPLGGKVVAATAAVATLIRGDDEGLDDLQDELDPIMEECAKRAEQTVNQRRLEANASELCEEDEEDGDGGEDTEQPQTHAMQLGKEKHKEALKCVEEKLSELIPGHFLIEQRYLYDRARGRIKPISKEEIERLVRTGQAWRLKGSLEPDVVIHAESPTLVRFIYDFKFPCKKGAAADWRVYPPGHPYHGLNQGRMYREAFHVTPARVVPGRGVDR